MSFVVGDSASAARRAVENSKRDSQPLRAWVTRPQPKLNEQSKVPALYVSGMRGALHLGPYAAPQPQARPEMISTAWKAQRVQVLLFFEETS